jgi:DNA ligase 1
MRWRWRAQEDDESGRGWNPQSRRELWQGQPMTPLVTLVSTSQRVGASSGRLAKVRELAEALRALDTSEIEIAVQYLSGDTPQGKIGISYALLQAAMKVPPAAAPSLTIHEVDRRLGELAQIRGSGSTALRKTALNELFALATQPEQEFLVRLLVGELRQGALAGVMLDAIAAAATLPVARVRRAAMYAPNLGEVARVGMIEGEGALTRFQLALFSPVVPMLAQTAADAAEALEQLEGEVAFEWKMDGARVQVHKAGDDVRIYTRTLNDVTAAVPEIVEAARALPAREIILDGEAIAFTAGGRPHPFQITMRRFGRRRDVEAMREELPIRGYFFDCLRLESDSLIDRSTQDRFESLARAVPEELRVPRLVTAAVAEADAFYAAALAAGHEGLMAKSLNAPYEAGNRGASWLKIKKAHTLDLVVLAAEWGHGRRTGKLSNLHLGALDPATGEYVMLGNTFKGLTDVMLEWQTREFLARETRRDNYTVYVRPELVVEIAFSDLQVSPRYPGGLALRLARVKRYRDDKRAEDADNMESVREIAARQ